MSKILYLGLGSNMGNRSHFLQQAAQWIQIKIGAITKNSRIYETAAWGNANQQAFYNQVLEVATTMSPSKTLETCLEITKKTSIFKIPEPVRKADLLSRQFISEQ